MATTFADVIRSKYLLLTTFTKDGRPKPTAIWGVPEGDKLLVITDDGSWKTKRIKNTPRVTIAKSGSLGKKKSDEVEGVARILPKSETRRVYNAVLQAVLVPRPVVLRALDRARWNRQGSRGPGDHPARWLARLPRHCALP